MASHAKSAESALVPFLAPWPTLRTLQPLERNPQTSRPELNLQSAPRMWVAKCCVYVLRSLADPERYYTGITGNCHARLEAHNAGRCLHTANGRPWKIDVVVEFADERRAVAFERYLKSGAGCAFAQRHFR